MTLIFVRETSQIDGFVLDLKHMFACGSHPEFVDPMIRILVS